MHPVIGTLGPFTFYSYGLMLVVAFFVATGVARATAVKNKIPPEAVFNFSFLVLVAGIFGARILYIIEHFSYYRAKPYEIIMLQHGGLSWFGGLVAGSLGGVIYLRRHRQPIIAFFDNFAPALAFAHAIGRIGCFLNGCCFGRPLCGLPLQIVSSLLLFLIFLVLWFLQRAPHRRGSIFFTYLLLYSLKRFFVEFLRLDNPPVWRGFSLFHLISVALFTGSLAALYVIRKKNS
ncbi:MAG: prolipoprotein diacylglyceryl transferase [Candidatus Omnitrophica bacterium]|nr:prolipoprotein diacylglyceryl transferase [Candidatus Omnitrophota bacterium]